MCNLFVGHSGLSWERVLEEVDTFTDVSHRWPQSVDQPEVATPRGPQPDMHRQSMASRSQFGQSSAQAATTQALRNKKKECEAISALEKLCAELITTLEEMATDLNTTAEATIGTVNRPNAAEGGVLIVW